jgi:uncharacterized protein
VGQNESFDFAGPAGRLEAILMRPAGDAVAAGVVCHAHPQHGGVMHFKVVFRAARALQDQSVAALRFNFRGVGRSEGEHDHGRGEQDDVRAALDEAERRCPGLPLVLGGFSFGSSMALRVAANETRVRAVFALGFPLTMLNGDADFVASVRAPRLFVQGALDRFGDGAAIARLAAGLPPPCTVRVVDDADHFFHGRLDVLQETVASWVAGRPWEAP